MIFDDIIVGAGSSGVVLAARLSENTSREVLLIESGPEYRDVASTPGDLLYGQVSLVDHDWGYTALATAGRTIAYPRGKVVGGSSAVNGTIALRGDPADFGEWASRGLPEWAWPEVQPFYRLVEDDPGGSAIDPIVHRAGGVLPIDRVAPAAWQPFHRAFHDACCTHGFAPCPDLNGPGASGVGVFPRNKRNGIRMSTALTYLAAARDRPNLTLRSDVHVDHVVVEGGRAIAVEALHGGQRVRFAGRRITLAAGAIASPAILLRSGIGPSADLAAMALPCAVDLPVGECCWIIRRPVCPGYPSTASPTTSTS